MKTQRFHNGGTVKTVILLISITLVSVMEMSSCTHSSSPTPVISFSADIIPIFTTYCALNSSCHMGANSTNQFTNFDADSAYYTLGAKKLVITTDPSASLLYAEVETNEMPLQPYPALSAANQAIILDWIKQGAKNN